MLSNCQIAETVPHVQDSVANYLILPPMFDNLTVYDKSD